MDKTQIAVARGMALAMLTALAAFTLAITLVSPAWSVGSDLTSRITLASWTLLLPAGTLFICIARLAKHRFFTPEDIHGSALIGGTEKAKLLQSLLQNTLEQCCLAFPVYLAGSITAPASILPVVPAAALMFLVGRVLFFAGYAKGAPARAYGFALTFYPTVLLLLILLAVGALRAAAYPDASGRTFSSASVDGASLIRLFPHGEVGYGVPDQNAGTETLQWLQLPSPVDSPRSSRWTLQATPRARKPTRPDPRPKWRRYVA